MASAVRLSLAVHSIDPVLLLVATHFCDTVRSLFAVMDILVVEGAEVDVTVEGDGSVLVLVVVVSAEVIGVLVV